MLRERRGYSREDSLIIAPFLVNLWARCFVCGVPLWWLRDVQKFWYQGEAKNNQRFVPDRIDVSQPHTLDNTRICCYSCNHIRGQNIVSDEAVLRTMRKFYMNRDTTVRQVDFWLREKPGCGGSAWRTEAAKKRDRRLHTDARIEFEGPEGCALSLRTVAQTVRQDDELVSSETPGRED